MKIVLYVNGIHLFPQQNFSAQTKARPFSSPRSIAQSARRTGFTLIQSNIPQNKYIQIDKYFYVNNFSRVTGDGSDQRRAEGKNVGNADGRVDEEPPSHASLLIQM